MLRESNKDGKYKRGGALFLAGLAAGAVLGGSAVAARGHGTGQPVVVGVVQPAPRVVGPARPVVRRVRVPVEAKSQPHSRARATISLYEHTAAPTRLRRQGCSAAKRSVGGIVILDFGQPAYNGHTYGTYLFSGRFAGNRAITRALYSYAYGYHRCLRRHSGLTITLARGTSNYHPQVPSAYKAGRKWARETMALQRRLLAHPALSRQVTSAAADDVEPAWDRPFHHTRDFFRGYRDAHTGHTLYNYGSLDGGVGSVWNARQVFFVTSGMRDAQAIPEIYNHAMAREWAELAHIARHRYHRPLKFAGVMTTHTSRNRGLKPRDAHRTLVRELASRIGSNAPDVPAALTNIRSAG